jgi:uncharacterized protein YbjT (DUF2867 family)
MKIVITTPTGRVGSKVVENLLSSKAKLILLSRDADKARRFVRKNVEIRQGSLDDLKFVVDASYGADVLFWITPPNMTASDLRHYQNLCGRAAAEAVRVNGIPRVVNLSSVGAHLGSGTGPINGLHDVEILLDGVAQNITHLRPGWFFENFLHHVNSIRDFSAIFLPIEGTTRYPMIATKDIAAAACEVILDTAWKGRNILGLHGPTDLSLIEAAERLSRGVGREIRYVKISDDEARKAMRSTGFSDNVIELMLELYHSVENGTLKVVEPRTGRTTTPTTLEQFSRDVLAPLIRQEVGASVS